VVAVGWADMSESAGAERNTSAISFARYFITSSSIALLLIIMLAFALGPTLGLPLTFDQSFLVVKQIAPVLVGYLGQCAFYVVRGTKKRLQVDIQEVNLLYMISIAPFVIFSVVFLSVIVAFALLNSSTAIPGTGMSFSRFTDWISILLGIFTATISVLTAWIFHGRDGG
jgi:hypothetical protein